MWFVGMLIGMLVGSLGGAGTAFLGAFLGAVVGAVLASSRKSVAEDSPPESVSTDTDDVPRQTDVERKIDHIYKSLEDIHWRLTKLEKPDVHPESQPQSSAPASAVQPTAAPTAMDYPGRYALPAAPPAPAATVPRAVLTVEQVATYDQMEALPPQVSETQPARAEQPAAIPLQSESVAQKLPPAEPIAEHAAKPQRVEPVPVMAAAVREDDDAGPARESWWQRLFAGNIVAKVGVVILFFGVGFLLKYTYDHAFMPVPVRLAVVAFAGFGKVFCGWKLQAQRRLFGLILQGAGIGVLYLDVFFALRVFTLIHPTLGFALFIVLGIAATLLAVKQDAKVLAVLGLTGAFLAPVLAGSHEGNHVLLFSYYTLLNGFIIAISWFKSWRDLNLTGFIFTFIVGVVWGANNYRPELFSTVEPFVLIFFAMYLVIPILFATRQPPELKGLVDGTLVFGTPLSAAFMQAALVRGMPYGLAWSAGCAAGLYALLALFVLRREGMRLLGETYVALAVGLATLTIFFALDAYPTFALWSLEGAAIVWVGLRQQRVLARAFGLLVQLAGAAYFVLHYNDYEFDNPWFNDFVLGSAMIFVASTLTAWLMHKHRAVLSGKEEWVQSAMLYWGCAWWFIGALHAFHHGLLHDFRAAAALMLFGASFGIAEWAGSRLDWLELRNITRVHVLLMALTAAAIFLSGVSRLVLIPINYET